MFRKLQLSQYIKVLKSTNKLNNQAGPVVCGTYVCECATKHGLWVFDVRVEPILVHREICHFSSVAFMYTKIFHIEFQQ